MEVGGTECGWWGWGLRQRWRGLGWWLMGERGGHCPPGLPLKPLELGVIEMNRMPQMMIKRKVDL